jgi:ribosomal protein S18 acetylase RimI-like enzyme
LDQTQLLLKYIFLQEGLYYNKQENCDTGVLTISELDRIFHWTRFVPTIKIEKEDYKCLLKKYSSLHNKLAFYVLDNFLDEDVEKGLSNLNYKKIRTDVFMTYQQDNSPKSSIFEIKKVESKRQLKEFIQVLIDGFEVLDQKYISLTKSFWDKNFTDKSIQYFLLYHEGIPAAIGMLTSHNRMGYLSNIATKKQFRGIGLGKSITNHLVEESIKNGNNLHILNTIKGNAENFYHKLGFEESFEISLFNYSTFFDRIRNKIMNIV